MRIGIIKETKVPEDNRVALSPQEIVDLQQKFPVTPMPFSMKMTM